jgi:hypothetical protein
MCVSVRVCEGLIMYVYNTLLRLNLPCHYTASYKLQMSNAATFVFHLFVIKWLYL